MRILRFLAIQTLGLVAASLCVWAWGPAAALAEVPALNLQILSVPTNLPRGGEGTLKVRISNLGDAATEGEANPIVITDKLPPGLTATGITGGTFLGGAQCELVSIRCEWGILAPYQTIQMEVTVKVSSGAPASVLDEASVTGGGSRPSAARDMVTVSD